MQILAIVRYNFRGFWKNPKCILTFLLGFVLCYLLSTRVMAVIETYHTPVQIAEPFLWTFGDAGAIQLSSVLLLLLFSDLPYYATFNKNLDNACISSASTLPPKLVTPFLQRSVSISFSSFTEIAPSLITNSATCFIIST